MQLHAPQVMAKISVIISLTESPKNLSCKGYVTLGENISQLPI